MAIIINSVIARFTTIPILSRTLKCVDIVHSIEEAKALTEETICVHIETLEDLGMIANE